MRTFVAVTIQPTGPLKRVLTQLGALGDSVRAVPPDNLHVTLKFLGETDNNDIVAACRIIKQVAADVSPFALRLQGLGVFPRIERPNVVWAGLEQADPLVQIVSEFENRFEELGFPRESRAFHPHLTLARVKRRPPEELFELLEANSQREFGTAEVTQVEYFQSHLKRDGARYAVLATEKLTGG